MPSSPRKTFLFGFVAGFVAALLLLVAGLLGAAFFLRDTLVERRAERLEAPPLAPGMKAEYGWSVVDASGKKIPLSDFEGTPIFLHFWSPSCLSCEAEVASLNKLYEDTKDSGVAFIAISADTKADELDAAARRLGIKYPVYTVDAPVPSVFQFTAGPATFIIDHTGLLVFKHVGASKWDGAAVVGFLRALGITAKMPAPQIEVPEMFREPGEVPPDAQ